MVYLTGDTHGQFDRIFSFCKRLNASLKDTMVILGDVGFNYHLNFLDDMRKEAANKQAITWFCLKGNHEKYAGALPNYKEVKAFGGSVYLEPEYPNILFAKDGEVYTFKVDGLENKILVIGGAYSVDKYYRLKMGLSWFEDEQPSGTVKRIVEEKIKKYDGTFDYIFSHTCPLRFEPREWFLKGLDQSKVDKSTEVWLDKIYDQVEVKRWYCGHYHGEKLIENVRFMYNGYVTLGD